MPENGEKSLSEEEFLQQLYDHFKATGEWPALRPMQLRNFNTNLRQLAKRIGPERVVCTQGSEESRCFLQLKEIPKRADSTGDQRIFVDAIRIIAKAYIDRGTQNVTLAEIASELKLSEFDEKKLSVLLWSAGGQIASMYGPRGSSAFYLQPLERMFWFRDVQSMEDYFATHARLDAEEAEGRRLDNEGLARVFGQAPPSEESVPDLPRGDYHLNNELLDKVYSQDRAELARVMDIQAWKAAAVLAGACLEGLLLDIWEARPAEAEREFGESWRANTRADRLAHTAIRAGYLTKSQATLVDLLRRWRNVIHPIAALRETAPTEELAHLLVAALNFLVAELRGFRQQQ